MQSVAIFDDGRGLMSPLTDLRPVFGVRTGALTTLERMTLRAQQQDLPSPDALLVPELLRDLVREAYPRLLVNELGGSADGAVLLVNGAAPLNDTDTTGVELGEAVVDAASGAILKAHVSTQRDAIDRVLRGDAGGLHTRMATHPPTTLLSRPWHVRAARDACIAADLAMIGAGRNDWLRQNGPASTERLLIAPSATVHPSAIFDTEHGPIVVADHAIVRPGTIIVGPAYVGPHSSVLERTLIKANTAIGPHCKVAGEIGGTIFQGFANKAHDGHLGDSWVGEWANLGAGTTNSNLLNTYGDVICRPLEHDGTPGANERTGQQFLGAIIGDHVKTAICTRITTGAIVGTGTMFAASRPLSGTVAAFSWITDSGTKAFAREKFVEIARVVMSRRKASASEAYLRRVRTLRPPRA